MKKAYLIAEILLERGMPVSVVKEITDLGEYEIQVLQRKWTAGSQPTGL
ncbi:hypothetical protein [Peribacillus cavernae]|nr:hypothetical protein [Peribacillus cavernae]MDQ0220260.1 hypothetical protein [Peribacillus cavernae]